MSRTRKFAKNVFFSAIAQIVTMICGFIVPKVMLKYYGSEINGLVTSITQVMTYVALIEGGLSGATIYALYRPLAVKDVDEISSIVSTSKKMYFKAGYIGLTATTLIAVCYPFFISTGLLSYWEIVFLFLIIATTTILDFFILAKYRSLLSADQKEYVISISTTIQVIINAVCVFIFSYVGLSVVFVRLISLTSILFRIVIIYAYCKKTYRHIDFNVKCDSKLLEKRWDALFLNILGAVHRGSPIIIATIFLSLSDVSIYSVYNMVVLGISSILSIFMNGLQASFGDVISRKQYDVLKKSFSQFEVLYLSLITLLYCITFATIMPFIKVYIGTVDINYIYPIIGALFVVNEFFYCLKNPQGMLVISAGLYRETKWRSMLQAIICVSVGIGLCYFIGIPGILVGRLISNIYRDIDLLIFIPKHFEVIKIKTTLFRWFIFIIAFFLFSTFAFYVDYSWIGNYFQWLIYASFIGIMALLYIFVVCMVFFRRDVVSVSKRIIMLFKNR